MKKKWPIILSICNLLATICACTHYGVIYFGLLKPPIYLINKDGMVFENLVNFWQARFVRRIISVLVRSPFRAVMLGLVKLTFPFPSDTGCVIAICRTPWKRLLVQWCLENNFAIVIAMGHWANQKSCIQRQGEGFGDLRGIVAHLRQNGKVVIAFDNFNNLKNCPVKFLGARRNIPLFPARLAKLASVPLYTVIPVLRNGAIIIDQGPQFDYRKTDYKAANVMKELITFLESKIIKEPGIWPANYYGCLAEHTINLGQEKQVPVTKNHNPVTVNNFYLSGN